MPISTKETNRGNTEWEPGAEWQAFRYPCVCVIGLNSNPPLLSACMLRLLNCPWFPAVFSSSRRQTVLLCYCQIHFTVSRPLNHLHPEITASGRDIFSFGQKTEKRTQSHHKLFCKYTIDKKKNHIIDLKRSNLLNPSCTQGLIALEEVQSLQKEEILQSSS